MKYKRLTKEQMAALRNALSSVELSQLQDLRSYINGLVAVASSKSTTKEKSS